MGIIFDEEEKRKDAERLKRQIKELNKLINICKEERYTGEILMILTSVKILKEDDLRDIELELGFI